MKREILKIVNDIIQAQGPNMTPADFVESLKLMGYDIVEGREVERNTEDCGGECHADCTPTTPPCEVNALQAQNSRLVEALEPFAKFACDPPCGCHNCRARTALGREG